MKTSFARRLLYIIGIPVLFALVVRFVFGIERWSSVFTLMSIAFIFLVPVGIGALTIALSKTEQVRNFNYRFFVPWLPILAFFFITLLISIEGLACWIMVLPIFLIGSSVGGLLAAGYKLRNKNDKVFVSFLALLPFFVSPVEQAIDKIPGQYRAYTFVDIAAPAEKIWSHVTRVSTIRKEEDKGWLTAALGFPRPIRAELNYEGAGAFRKAIIDKGLVFDETVTLYEPQKKMVFSIKANPHDIPPATLDEHVVIGGKFFDVLKGTYELQRLNDTTYRLHLYSQFKLTTSFNFYASWWAGWIMKDIQQKILAIIKERSEK